MTEPLYARVMGDAWFQLAEPIRNLHSLPSTARAHGNLRVEGGSRRLSRILARSLRLPTPAGAVPAELLVTALDDCERWQRAFRGQRLETWQYCSEASELVERYGVLEFRFALRATDGKLCYEQRDAALRVAGGRLTLPGYLAPQIEAFEAAAAAGRVSVGVRVTLPGVGLLVAYDGVIDFAEPRA